MKVVKTDQAPQAIGPYSQAVVVNGMIFCSGQIPIDTSGKIVSDDVAGQTRQVINNLASVLTSAGSGLDKVVKTTIYLTDINEFENVNEVYGSFFNGNNKPARATVEVSRLPKDVKVEIDCVAIL